MGKGGEAAPPQEKPEVKEVVQPSGAVAEEEEALTEGKGWLK